MGKEWWLYWTGGGGNGRSTKRGRSGGERNTTNTASGCMSAVFQLFDWHQFQLAVPQQQQQPSNSFIPDDSIHLPEEANIVLKGVEAPRNSLESEGPVIDDRLATSSSSRTYSSTVNQEHSFNLPMGIQIKTSTTPTSTSKSRTDDLSSECSSSPGTKTPNLVARLMGLDLLPELSSPRVSNSSSTYSATPNLPSKSTSSPHQQHYCRSLPETPRISMGRTSSDADNYHHRHSLQVNKENIFTNEEFDLSSFLSAKLARSRRESSCRQVLDDDIINMNSSSSSLYAKEIVKQVKENISRREVGADITNTGPGMSSGRKREKEQRRDEHLVLLKSKKPLSRMGQQESCSPRLRFLEVKNKPISPSAPKTPQNSLSPKSQVIVPCKEKQISRQQQSQQQDKVKKSKKITLTDQKYDFRHKKATQTSEAAAAIKNKQEEPFIRSLSTTKVKKLSEKKCRKTPLSNNLVNINAPNFLSFKKFDPSPSTRRSPPQNQVSSGSRSQLSKSQSQSYNSKATHMLTTRNNGRSEDNHSGSSANPIIHITTPTTTAQVAVDVHYYISRILIYCGIDRNTPISITQWYSPSSHPLHPSIFQRLQLSNTTTTTTSVAAAAAAALTSKLMFDLVDELLVEILKPYTNLKPWVVSNYSTTPVIVLQRQLCGWQLTEKLLERIGSFPETDCRALEDIDALIESDMRKGTQLLTSIASEEEGEGIVAEIERDIVDTLVHETAAMLLMWHVSTE